MAYLPIITISAPGGRGRKKNENLGDAMVLKPQELSTNYNIRGHLQLRHDPKKVSKAWDEVSSDACYAMVPLVPGRGRKRGNLEICVSRKGSNLAS